MCLFKKKKKKIINSKFKEDDFVSFFYKGELNFGFIYNIKEDENGKILYDVQIGGECPAILKDIKEIDLKMQKRES